MESTEASIAVFNRTLRRLRLVTLLTLVTAAIALAIAVTGRGTQAEVRARAFVLVDDSGEVLARLVKVKDGPLLVLHARKAGADVLIGSIVDDAGIGIAVDGQTRMHFLAGRDGYPSLSISDAKGANRILIGLDKKIRCCNSWMNKTRSLFRCLCKRRQGLPREENNRFKGERNVVEVAAGIQFEFRNQTDPDCA